MLAHSFISVPHIIMHVRSMTFTYIFVSMLAHVHILPDHETLSLSYLKKFVSCLAALLARAPKRRCLDRITSFWKAPMGNIDSRVSPFCILQAAIVRGTVQSNSQALAFFEAADVSRCWGHTQPCQWAICCIVPSPAMPRNKTFLLRSNRFGSPFRSYTHTCTDNYNLSIMIVCSTTGKLD